MPNEFLLSEFADVAAMERQTAFILAKLSEIEKGAVSAGQNIKAALGNLSNPNLGSKAAIDEIKQLESQVTGFTRTTKANAAELKLQSDILAQQGKTLIEVNNSLAKNIETRRRMQTSMQSYLADQKEDFQLLKAGTITQAEYNKRLNESQVKVEQFKNKISELNKEIKSQIKANFAAPNSIGEAQAQNVVLKRQVSRVDINDVDRIKELNALIDRNNALIDANSDKLSKQKINIGNYPTAFTSAFKTLHTELDNVNKKIAAGATGKELQDLTLKQTALNNVIQATGKDFATTNAQQGAFKEAAKQIGAIYGTNSTLFKSFNKEVGAGSKAINDVSKEVDAAAGGTGKLAKGFGSVFSVLRNIANIVPGLGLSGVILLLLTPLSALGNAFIELFSTIDKAKIKVQALNEVNEKAVEGYLKEKTRVEDLTAVVSDNTIALGTRKEALKQLIDISPEYLKGLTLENIATDEGKKILDGYITSLQRKSELEAASTVQTESNKIVADLKAQKQALIELAKAGKVSYDDLSEEQRKFFDNSTSIGRINFTASLFNLEVPKSDIDQAIKNMDKEIQKAGVKVKASVDIFKEKFKAAFDGANAGPEGIIKKLRDQIDSLTKIQPTLLTEADIKSNVAQIKKLQDELDRLLGKDKKKKSAIELESTKEALNKEYEDYKIAQNEKIKLLEDDVKNEKLSYTERFTALSNYSDAKLDLIKHEADEEIRKLDEKEKALQENFKKAKATEKNNIKIELNNIKVQKSNISKSAAVAEREVLRENGKEFDEILKQQGENELKIRKETYDRTIKLLDAARDQEQEKLDESYSEATLALKKRYDNNEISLKQYNAKKLKLEVAYRLESLQNE